ncbi:MAG: LysM peptidoglycan-binding domain-containing protein, partial [Nitrospiraceae bacterium]
MALWLTALSVHAQLPEIEREIADFDRQIHQNRERVQLKGKSRSPIEDEINKNQAAIAELERRLGLLHIALEALRRNTSKPKNNLETALSHPDLVDSQKLQVLHGEHRAALASESVKEDEAVLLTKELDGYRNKAENLRAKKKGLEIEIDILNRELLSFTLKKPVIVESAGECVMHEDITPKACQNQAMLKAKQTAIETGETSLVQSLTEVSMSDIVRDEISLKTLAKIRYIEILQPPRFTAHGELGKYVAKIRAVVQSQMPEIQPDGQSPVSEGQAIAPSPMPKPEAVVDTAPLVHIVKLGETLYRIAVRYGVTLAQVRRWNHMPDDIIEVGQRLIVGKQSAVKIPETTLKISGTAGSNPYWIRVQSIITSHSVDVIGAGHKTI